MTRLRLMTFNVENMLLRFEFDPETEASLATLMDAEEPAARAELVRTYWNNLNDEMRVMTALAIRDGAADVVCLQEVESMRGLRAFHDRYLRRMTELDYQHSVLIEGNDGRHIDVAVMSRFPLERIVTHQALRWDELQSATSNPWIRSASGRGPGARPKPPPSAASSSGAFPIPPRRIGSWSAI